MFLTRLKAFSTIEQGREGDDCTAKGVKGDNILSPKAHSVGEKLPPEGGRISSRGEIVGDCGARGCGGGPTFCGA